MGPFVGPAGISYISQEGDSEGFWFLPCGVFFSFSAKCRYYVGPRITWPTYIAKCVKRWLGSHKGRVIAHESSGLAAEI